MVWQPLHQGTCSYLKKKGISDSLFSKHIAGVWYTQEFRCSRIDMLTTAIPECSHIALGCSASRYQLFKLREKSLENTEFSSKPHFSLLQDQWRFPLQWKGEMSISFQYICCLTAAKDTSVGNSCVEQFAHPGAGGSQTAAVVVSWRCSIFLERPPRTLDNTLRQSLEAPLSQPKGCPPASMKPVTISFP